MRASNSLAFAAILVLGGCGGSDSSQPPVEVSLVAPASTDIAEAAGEKVRVAVAVDRIASTSILATLVISGSATRGQDYEASAESIIIPAYTPSASVEVDVYRDFDMEGDETITISLGEIEGNGQAGARTSIDLVILDGEPANPDKTPGDHEDSIPIFPTHFAITEESVEFGAAVFNVALEGAAPTRLTVEWSSDIHFGTDVNLLDLVDIPVFTPDFQIFPPLQEFSLPLNLLAPNETYFIRLYLGSVPEESDTGQPAGDQIRHSFATNADGRVITQCQAPVRVPSATASDPLFSEQWHLQNSGQSAFSAGAGVAGADLAMSTAIRDGHDGDGVKLAVVDTGLEICHPDLAANVEPGESFNFASEVNAGSSPTDPFNHDVLGDHGTSVAGVAAAVAGNGLGGRGVASGVELRAFNLGTNLAADSEFALLNSLGGSSENPDSASAHIFNMSFGTVAPAQNPVGDFVRLLQMGTTELRSGRGALYVKAAGNAFDFCGNQHPLNRDVGCISSNSDPDENLPYMINVGAFNASDVKSSYSSAGANLWVVAPGGEGGIEAPGIVTTDQFGVHAGFDLVQPHALTMNHPLNMDGDYIATFGGTSSAAPAAAGAIAIVLGVNPDLTWRDVKHILATSARRIDPDIREVRASFGGNLFTAQHAWQTNAAGYPFHNWYGFGAIAVDDAVAMAQIYIPDSLGEFVESPWFGSDDAFALDLAIPDYDGAGVTDTFEVSSLPGAANIEAVVLEISVDHRLSSDLAIQLTSPSGTQSILNPPFNRALDEFPLIRGWQVLSNAFYGEQPNGSWTVQVVDLQSNDTGSLRSWRLRFYYGDHPEN